MVELSEERKKIVIHQCSDLLNPINVIKCIARLDGELQFKEYKDLVMRQYHFENQNNLFFGEPFIEVIKKCWKITINKEKNSNYLKRVECVNGEAIIIENILKRKDISLRRCVIIEDKKT